MGGVRIVRVLTPSYLLTLWSRIVDEYPFGDGDLNWNAGCGNGYDQYGECATSW